MNARGFTLIELIVAMVVMAILGTALVRIMVDDSRFVSKVDTMMFARQSARAAMNVMTSELQMVADGGLQSATTKSVTVRIPYAFGMFCGNQGANRFASIVPTDSAMFAAATPSGIAWRDSTDGQYTFVPNVTVGVVGTAPACTADSIRVLPGGQALRIRGAGGQVQSGMPFFVYEEITYSFEDSADLPGRIGLYRTDGGGTKEELIAPFDTSAGFGFLVGQSFAAQSAVPGDLSTVRGLQLKLIGESHQNPQGTEEPSEFDLVTSVAFRNMMN